MKNGVTADFEPGHSLSDSPPWEFASLVLLTGAVTRPSSFGFTVGRKMPRQLQVHPEQRRTRLWSVSAGHKLRPPDAPAPLRGRP